MTMRHWSSDRSFFSEQVEGLLTPLKSGADTIKSHPVYGFLFTYYSFRESLLRRWSPGAGIFCEGALPGDFLGWSELPGGGWIDPASVPQKRKTGLIWSIELLKKVQSRPRTFGCFGLHEWAMVYRENQTRHSIPLRLSPKVIANVVENGPLCCTHYDAFRFFSRNAIPLNRHQLQRTSQHEFEQGGCLHVTMDLYKWAYKFYPWVSSDLILEAFQLARDARVLDMQASPYDLQKYGLNPVEIETVEGRREYETRQRGLSARADPLRIKILDALEALALDPVQSMVTN